MNSELVYLLYLKHKYLSAIFTVSNIRINSLFGNIICPMKGLIIVIFMIIPLAAGSTTYYVATNGDDQNPGTIDRPFASWQKGFDISQPGDTVYIRGGTYFPTGKHQRNVYSGVIADTKDGTADKPIRVWSYPGETPVLDCSKINQAGSRAGIYIYNSDYWHLKGLNITSVGQEKSGSFFANGIRIYSGNFNKLEGITSYANGGSGITIVYASEENYILNCDSYNNYDEFTSGKNADGIEIADIFERNGNERINTIRGCRVWDNSDDGFDHFKCEGILVIDSCWAWHNGVVPGTDREIGDGNGFKLGGTFGTPEKVPQRTLTNCLAVNHRQNGFSQQGANVNMILLNNTSYRNRGWGYEFVDFNMTDTIRNNLSFKDRGTAQTRSNQVSDHNSWQTTYKISSSDFVSLDENQLSKPRKQDGSLPQIDFLNLSADSKLIDAGIAVSKPFKGNSPDIGAFESDFHETPGRFNLFLLFINILLLP